MLILSVSKENQYVGNFLRKEKGMRARVGFWTIVVILIGITGTTLAGPHLPKLPPLPIPPVPPPIIIPPPVVVAPPPPVVVEPPPPVYVPPRQPIYVEPEPVEIDEYFEDAPRL